MKEDTFKFHLKIKLQEKQIKTKLCNSEYLFLEENWDEKKINVRKSNLTNFVFISVTKIVIKLISRDEIVLKISRRREDGSPQFFNGENYFVFTLNCLVSL